MKKYQNNLVLKQRRSVCLFQCAYKLENVLKERVRLICEQTRD